MNKKTNQTSSRDAVLDAAEELFMARGYTTVTLKHVAQKLNIKQASLYYHFPLGKEDLYFEVVLRSLERRHIAIANLISRAQPTLESCLLEVGVWLIEQPPLNVGRMIMSDLPELSPDKAAQLEAAMYRCAFAPIEGLFTEYRHRFKAQFQSDVGFIGGTFLSSLESLYAFRKYSSKTDEELVMNVVELVLRGSLSS